MRTKLEFAMAIDATLITEWTERFASFSNSDSQAVTKSYSFIIRKGIHEKVASILFGF